MIRIIRWFIGFVEFSFSGGFSEGFINSCLAHGCNISEVRFEGETLCASCPAALYPRLRKLAAENGGRLKIVKKHGLVFHLFPLRNRVGLFAGALSAVVIVCVLTGFVWNVEITGTKDIPPSEVTRLLEENGLKVGSFKRSVEKDRLESLLLAAFPDCAWAHINEQGTTMRVEISEGVITPSTVDKSEYSNLKAAKDGVIVKAVVFDGWQVKRKGEAVTKGDILVSGVFESEKKKMNLFAHASGEYIAEVKEPVKLEISRTQRYKSFVSENEYKYLYFFGLKIPLFLTRCVEGDVSEDSSYLELNGVKLPLGVVTKSVKTYVVLTKTLSDRELKILADGELDKKLEQEFSECEIINRKLETALNADSITVSGYVTCLENIGEEIKIIP